jgi:hypothetical protein
MGEENLIIFMKKEKIAKQLTKEVDRDVMLADKKWRECIHKYNNPNGGEVADDTMKHYIQTKAMELEEMRQDSNYKPFFKKEIEHFQRGSELVLKKNYCSCLRKGCYCNPLPCCEMSYHASKDPMEDGSGKLKRLGGTNVVESDNRRSAEEVTGEVSCQGSELLHQKMLLFSLNWNLAINKNIQHVTGVKAKE